MPKSLQLKDTHSLVMTLAKTDAAVTALLANPSATPEQLCKLALIASQMSNTAAASTLLKRLAEGTTDKAALAVVHNNLACVERRQGQHAAAVQHLEVVVQCEGGVGTAQPTTLVNLSAAYAAVARTDEAAALAHRAVLRSKQVMASGAVRSAAHFNLGSALESADQNEPALEAYRQALQSAPTNKPNLKLAATNAIAAVERKVAAASPAVHEEWTRTVRPALATLGSRLPPIGSSDSFSFNRSLVPVADGGGPSRASAPGNAYRKEFIHTYFTSVREFHCPMHPLTPEPYTNAERHNASLRVATTAPLAHRAARSQSATLLEDSPSWNYDPVLEPREISHRLKNVPRDWLLLRVVDQRYIPRALVPLVEDIRYKECTRRSAIEKEYKKRLRFLWHHGAMAFVRAGEDSERVSIEIEETRVRRVLHQWIVGKRLFAQASLLVAKQEQKERVGLVAEASSSALLLEQHATLLHPVAQEEHVRRNVSLIELDEHRTLAVRHAAAIATLESTSTASQKKRATAYALALWCIEGVIAEQDLWKVEDKDRKLSLAVMERNAMFNRFLTAPR
jgi:hypothetical protein